MQIARIEGAAPPMATPTCKVCSEDNCAFRQFFPDRRMLTEIRLERGQRLECSGDDCLKFWVILSGTAATCIAFSDGRRQIATIEGEGDTVCGPMAGYGTENWLEALTELEVCEIDLSGRARELRHDAQFLADMFQMIHKRLTASMAHVSMLGRLDSQERVTLFLAEMAVRTGAGPVTLPMSREDIADYLGLNTETVSRLFTRIRKSGLVRFLTPTEYLIPDMAALQRRLPVEIRGYDGERLS